MAGFDKKTVDLGQIGGQNSPFLVKMAIFFKMGTTSSYTKNYPI
jgi:hypothetical protein